MRTVMKRFLGAALTAMSVCLAGCGRKTVAPMTYVETVCEGVDGKGTLRIEFDDDAFCRDITAAVPERKQEVLKKMLDKHDPEDFLTIKADKTKDLHNGDEVTVSIDFDDTLLESFKVGFDGDVSRTVTVEGLQEPIVLDAFDPEIFNVDLDHKGVHFRVEGISPKLQISLKNEIDKSDPRSKLQYRTDGNCTYQTFANGDEIPVTVSIGSGLDSDLYVLKEETGTVKLEGYDAYVQRAEDIAENAWPGIEAEFKDRMNAMLAGGSAKLTAKGNNIFYTYAITNDNAEQINYNWDKAYLLTLKSGVDAGNHYGDMNRLVVPVELNASGVKASYGDQRVDFEGLTCTFTVSDLVVSSDGSVTVSPDDIRRDFFEYADDLTLSEALDKHVYANADMYTVTEIDISHWNAETGN